VEALSDAMVASMVDLAMQIFAVKMDQRLMAGTASISWA
jgi:hypothetical protein